MDLAEIVGCGVSIVALGGVSYVSALYAIQTYDSRTSEKFDTGERMREVFIEEAEKLGLDPFLIDVSVGTGSRVQRSGVAYKLVLKSPFLRSDIKHELYHIARGHCDDTQFRGEGVFPETMTLLKYLFIQEPQATLYGTFNIKL